MSLTAEPMPQNEPSNTMKKVGTVFREIGRMSGPGPKLMSPVKKPENINVDDYTQFCRTMLGNENILSDELLNKRILYLAQNGKLKLHLPEGSRCCLAVVPCDNFANKLEDNNIKSGSYLRTLIIPGKAAENNKDGKLTLDPKYDVGDQLLYSSLPEDAKKAGTFDVHYKDQEPYSIDPKDRTEIIEKFTAAYKSLQELFNPTIH